MKTYDVVVVGGGPGGLAAAQGAKRAGARRVLVLERENRTGGILNQCIHDGFGLVRYQLPLTGPEYALQARQEALDAGATLFPGATVMKLTADRTLTAVSRQGYLQVQAGAVVLATGCRERTRGATAIPGTRPAGIYTAGTAQNLMNLRNLKIGRSVVILGSGDIGLIMARRLTLEGAHVRCVVEQRGCPGGLERNVSQCLYDFSIPLHLRCTVTKVLGAKRVEEVELTDLDHTGCPLPGSNRQIPCDTLLLSVGLIPENELAATAGILLDPKTNGAITDPYLQTNIPGVFACGNSRCVMDLADFVTTQGLAAGENAARFASGRPLCEMPPETSNTMAKGLPQANCVTCILCPKGCRVYRSPEDGSTFGHACPRGEDYARQEQTAPQRILTTVLKRSDGSLLPVKSASPLPRDQLRRCAAQLRSVVLSQHTIHWGDPVLPDPFGTGIAMVATAGELPPKGLPFHSRK